MFKKLLVAVVIFLQIQISFAQLNMSLLGKYDYPGSRGDVSDIWGYVDEFGNEYAIVGNETGVS
ncbi:MAG: hypothetical protein KJZ55_09235, partial [Flavobacteriales bacterium]|nr:hypothetical protein [Flavobacteriales bacterium]